MDATADAVLHIAGLLRSGTAPDEAIADAAEEFDFKPALLVRKFSEAHNGLAPADWIAEQGRLADARAALAQKTLELATNKAISLAKNKYRLTDETALKLAGRIFTNGNQQYAWVMYGGDDPKWAIRAIRVSDHRLVNFHQNDWVEIMAQIAPNVRLVT